MEIEAGGWTFTALEGGPTSGEPVLLLHGFPEGARCWEGVIDALSAAGLRCVAPDQRGYSPGARPSDVAAYSLPEVVGDALAILDELGWPAAHVVGHDWGAMVAWALAAQHPARVRTLTAVSVPHPQAFSTALRTDLVQKARSAYLTLFRKPGIAERILLAADAAALRALFAGSGLDKDAVDAFVRPLQEDGALTAALNWYRAMDSTSYLLVGGVDVPTTYVWGTEDIAVGRTAAEGAVGYVRADYTFVPLDGISHWVPEQVPDVLAAHILTRVRGAT